MSDKDVNITYDTLFELLRREKNREELQQLPETFFADVVIYLREKNNVLSRNNDDNVFSAEEKEKTKGQLDNVKKIIKEFYEKRERKIMEMAIFKSRTNTSLINTSNLLAEEKMLFESLITNLSRYRSGILMNVLNATEPILAETPVPQLKAQHNLKAPDSGLKTEAIPHQGDAIFENAMISIKFLSSVPKFVGRELEIYGPFQPEDIANLPKPIADVLIMKGRAEQIIVN